MPYIEDMSNTATTATANRTDGRIVVTFDDGTTDQTTKGKRADRATCVLVVERNGERFIYGMRSDVRKAEVEAVKLTTYSHPTCVNPYDDAFVLEVTS